MAVTPIHQLQFVASDHPFDDAVKLLARELALVIEAGSRAVWFVSGGSAALVAAKVSAQIPATKKLLVLQVDERYGLPNHPDANWRYLLESGFEASKFVCMPMLGDDDFETVITKYDALLEKVLSESAFSVGLFGIGKDGHTAGLLPDSAALKSKALVAGFQGPDYQRITMTQPAIARLDLAVGYAVGADKEPALQDLQKDISFAKQPAQALKAAKRAIIYNDHINTKETHA